MSLANEVVNSDIDGANNNHPSITSDHHSKHSHRRCGGLKHAQLTRPCHNNDTDCGRWHGRYWKPYGCFYQDISSEQARKCLGNRTLAFIGDSQIRDLSVGVVHLLMGQSLKTASEDKFDYKGNLSSDGTRIEEIPFWKNNVPPHNYNGYVFPKKELAEANGYQWQIQQWSLYANLFIDGQVNDILDNNKLIQHNPLLRPIDLAFWGHGLHDYGWFNEPPYGKKFFDVIVYRWINARTNSKVPSIWFSMNPECRGKLTYKLSNMDLQHLIVEEGNYYTNQMLLEMNLPYWDAGAVLRTPQRCNVSNDGVHVKMYVDIMRAKMLFNHLCDSQMNWRGSEDYFK
eukprot:gene16983-22480_t